MRLVRLAPDEYSFAATSSGCEKADRWRWALHVSPSGRPVGEAKRTKGPVVVELAVLFVPAVFLSLARLLGWLVDWLVCWLLAWLYPWPLGPACFRPRRGLVGSMDLTHLRIDQLGLPSWLGVSFCAGCPVLARFQAKPRSVFFLGGVPAKKKTQTGLSMDPPSFYSTHTHSCPKGQCQLRTTQLHAESKCGHLEVCAHVYVHKYKLINK